MRRGFPVRAPLEHEELGFHAGLHVVAHGVRIRDHPLQRAARVSRKRKAIREVHVADDARDAMLGIPPRKHPECREVGGEEHVALLDPHEPLDAGAVEHDVARQRLLELARRQLDILVDAEDVGELQAKERDVLAPRQVEDVLRRGTFEVGEQSARFCHALKITGVGQSDSLTRTNGCAAVLVGQRVN